MRTILITLFIIPQLLFAQGDKLWRDVSPTARLSGGWDGMQVNRKELNGAALEVILGDMKRNGTAKITIPHPDGDEMLFDIQPSSLLSKQVQERHPEIQTFKGSAGKGYLLRMDISPSGLHATVFTLKEGTIYLDPATEGGRHSQYVSYFKAHYIEANMDDAPLLCETSVEITDKLMNNSRKKTSGFETISFGSQRKKYRIALTATPPFTSRRGGQQSAFDNMVAILNRAAGIYQRDLGITFELVTDIDYVFTNGNRGPFTPTNNPTNDWRNAAKAHFNDNLGVEGYDLGHVISDNGGGGRAALGSVCNDNLKALGISSTRFTSPGAFAVSMFTHELGHQFGAHHSFNTDCLGGFDLGRSNYELGNGTTIMSYAGLCSSTDVTDERFNDDYFHVISIQDITNYTDNSQGKNCVVLEDTGNTPPQVTVQQGDFVIPFNTPFMLEAEATDAENDALTYCWEQFDKGKSSPESVLPNNNNYSGDGPLFRSFAPTTDNKRYFPKLSKILNGQLRTAREAVPFKTRDLNFVVTVRDNNISGGGLTSKVVSFSSTDQAGPFVVTSTFSETEYAGFSNVLVEWEVANTNIAPVNCRKVTILYSIDGGKNFDITLSENTDNDGSATVKLPNIATSQARIMVKAAENVFLNVNNNNFNVVSSDVDIPEAATALVGDQVDNTTLELSWTDNSELEDGFIVERRTGREADFVEIGRTLFDVVSYTDNTIDPNELYAYRVAAFNVTGVSEYTNIVSFDGVILSMSDMEKIVSLYPNPATDEVYLPSSLLNQVIGVRIISLEGKNVVDYQLNTRTNKLDVSGLDEGLYLIHISTADRVIVKKFYKE